MDRSPTTNPPFSRRLLAFAGLLSVAVSPAHLAEAGATDPPLSLLAVEVRAGERTRTLALDTEYPGADIVQVGYPVQLLLWEDGGDSNYVRFDLAGDVYVGQESGLADGLSAIEAQQLLGTGQATSAAQLLRLERDRVTVSIPDHFPAGAARVQLYVVDPEGTFLSNGFALSVPSLGGS